MQRFQQGSQSIEDYNQELQKGIIRCGILEEPVKDRIGDQRGVE
jgi:hypothetical protein